MYLAFIRSSFVVEISIFLNFLKTLFNILFIHVRIDVSEALSLALSLPVTF